MPVYWNSDMFVRRKARCGSEIEQNWRCASRYLKQAVEISNATCNQRVPGTRSQKRSGIVYKRNLLFVAGHVELELELAEAEKNKSVPLDRRGKVSP